MKKLRVTVEGKVYEVLVEVLDEGTTVAPSPALAQTPVYSASIAVPASIPANGSGVKPSGAGDVPSPLAGKVVSIDVKTGDEILEGAQVATVEAMKMNTYIFAPKSGRVGSILVKTGDGVEEGTVLLQIG